MNSSGTERIEEERIMSKIRCVAYVGQRNELLSLVTFGKKTVTTRDDRTASSKRNGGGVGDTREEEEEGVHAFRDDEEHFVAYAALDEIDNRIDELLFKPTRSGSDRKKNPQLPNFLGFLGNTGDFQMFGYVSATKIKIIVCFEVTLQPQREVETLCKQLHKAYVSWMSNPFTRIPTNPSARSVRYAGDCERGFLRISQSASFKNAVQAVVDRFNSAGGW